MAKRILVADDSLLMRRQIRTILELDTDLEVCAEAADGLEAVRKARECRPDLAVLDFLMPGMNGLEATREIKKLMPTLPVLLSTLDDSPQLEWDSKQAQTRCCGKQKGADNFLKLSIPCCNEI